MGNNRQEYDYVVIGAGAAGSIVAGEAAAAGYSVLLLEAGVGVDPYERDVWDPTRWYQVLANPVYEVGFRSVPQANLDGRVLNLLQSRALGGCQVHNAMVYVRGGRSTYDHWAAELGCEGWDYESLVPFFESVEKTVGILTGDTEDEFVQSLFGAAARQGLPYNADYNTGPTEYGHVPFQFTVDPIYGTLRRTTTYEKYVRGRELPSLTVAPGTYVRRLLLGGGEPAVEYRDALGELACAFARREVVLSAGSIASPAILLRSGVGPADALRALGIEVVRDLPAVGQNFYDDLGVATAVLPSVPFPPQPYGNVAAGIFASDKGAPGSPAAYGDVNLQVQVSTSDLPGCPPLPSPHSSQPYCIIGAAALHLKSRGTVTLASADPYAAPLVDPGWLTDPEDLPHCLAALDLTVQIASDPELTRRWGWKVLSPDAFPGGREAYIRATGLTVQHYVGSCRMGPDAADAVVDPELRVYGVDGLRVIDASVAPTPVTGNTAGVSMVIGARGAATLLGSPPESGRRERLRISLAGVAPPEVETPPIVAG